LSTREQKTGDCQTAYSAVPVCTAKDDDTRDTAVIFCYVCHIYYFRDVFSDTRLMSACEISDGDDDDDDDDICLLQQMTNANVKCNM